MAAWLQKRLRDAEALLEQADKTAQRVVIKDKPIALPRVPSGSLGRIACRRKKNVPCARYRGSDGFDVCSGNDQESSAVDTSSRQALERPAQVLPNSSCIQEFSRAAGQVDL